MRFKEKILKLIFLFETGRSRIIGRIYGWWNTPLIIFIFLNQYGINISIGYMVGIIAIGMIITTILGKWYIKKQLYKIETTLSNQQDPQIILIQEDYLFQENLMLVTININVLNKRINMELLNQFYLLEQNY